MATLSSLSTIMPKMLDMAQGYAQSDPILEQVRKKRMEREEQDRKNSETASMNAYRKTEAKIKQQQSDLSSQAQQFMATLPPIDNSSNEARAASMRARINGMLNSNIPDVMELGKSLLTAVPQFIQMQSGAGSATTFGEEDYRAGTAAKQADAYNKIQEGQFYEMEAFGKAEDLNKFDRAAAEAWLKQNEHTTLWGWGGTTVNATLLAEQARYVAQTMRMKKVPADPNTAYNVAMDMIVNGAKNPYETGGGGTAPAQDPAGGNAPPIVNNDGSISGKADWRAGGK